MSGRAAAGAGLRASRRLAAVVLAVLAAGALARGLYIPAKAAVAQLLLARAWQRADLAGGMGESAGDAAAARPWPWADTVAVARLTAPRLGVRQVVLAGTSGEALAFGPGHLSSSDTPGSGGHVVLAGHRDTHFAFLRRLELGDELRLEAPGDASPSVYRVTSLDVVDERDLSPLEPGPHPALVLITCWPFDAARAGGPLRYAVRAELSSPSPAGVAAEVAVAGLTQR